MATAVDPTAEQNPKDIEPRELPDKSSAKVAKEEYEGVDEEEEEEELEGPVAAAAEREKMHAVFKQLSSDPVGIRVHDVVIKGNTKTREELIEAEVADLLRAALTVQDLLRAASARLRQLDLFDSVNITLDASPPELPGTLPPRPLPATCPLVPLPPPAAPPPNRRGPWAASPPSLCPPTLTSPSGTIRLS